MKHPYSRLVAPLLGLAILLGAAHAGEGGKEAAPVTPLPEVPHPITDMLFELQSLQSRMAVGDKTAYSKQAEALRKIGQAILAAPDSTWSQPLEIEAAAAYLLGGGYPRVIQKLLDNSAMPDSDIPLLKGSLAYVIGRAREADALLTDIDPRTVSLRLGGQLAFAQAVLATTRAPDRAIELLDLARLLAPGSLVEEAALRREILMIIERRDRDRALFLTRQYLSRFSHSIYADTFIVSVADAGVRTGLIAAAPDLQQFEDALGEVGPAQRRAFMLTAARAAMLIGCPEVAGAAAIDALTDMPAGDQDEMRARFYKAAAGIYGRQYDAGVDALKAIDRAKLGAPDQALYAASRYLAEHLRDAPSDAAFTAADREDKVAAARSPTPVEPNPNDRAGVTIKLGEERMKIADEMLAKPRSPP